MKKTVTLLLAAIYITSLAASAQGPTTDIEIDKIKTEPVPLQTSEYADVWLKVTNEGDDTADDVEVSFESTYPFSADPDEKTSWDIGTLRPGQVYQIHLQVKVDENAVAGNNSLEFETSTREDITITEKVPVEVRTDDAVLSINEVNFPSKVSPGSTETMNLVLENRADSQLKNIDVSLDLDADSLPFGTVDTTTKHLSKIEPGETEEVNFTIETDSSAENGLYKVPINTGFENEAGTSFEQDTHTGVVVGGEPELEVGVNEREVLSPGDSGTVTFRVINSGYGDASFVQLELQEGDGYEIISSDKVYLGDMESDDYQTAEFNIHATGSDISLPVKVSYRDSGEEVEEVQDVNLELYSSSQLKSYGMGGGNSTVLIGVAAVLVLAGGVYYWRRRKRRRE